MTKFIISIDQGTTSSRAVLFSESGEIVGTSQQEFTQHFPNDGWVEHDPEEIWQTTVESVSNVLKETNTAVGSVAAIGITNQRETTLVWDRNSGEVVYRAIVWQDRRTAARCDELSAAGWKDKIQEK